MGSPSRLVIPLLMLLLSSTTGAQDAPSDPETSLAWRTSIKVAALASRYPAAPELFADRVATDTLWRIRTEPTVGIGTRTRINVAYEQRVRWGTRATGVTPATILPATAAAPFRVTPLVGTISQSPNHSWEHEIDRLNVQMHLPGVDVTLGRQAIGWGRGVMFGAVDLFAPFTPLEVDREWRRGVDAAHIDVTLTDRSSIDVVAAFGQDRDGSALAARARGYTGSVDVEVAAGRRGRDLFSGATTSAAIGDAAVHSEVALFGTPSLDAEGGRHAVWKAIAGSSYRFPIGSGLLAYAEYHYSGFGAPRPQEILPLLTTSAFRNRYFRGDTQILSRHAVAVTGSYEQSPDLIWSGQWVFNPADGSGIIAPGFTLTLRDNTSLGGHAYLPYGRTVAGTQLRSEYGAAPLTAFLQLRVYF